MPSPCNGNGGMRMLQIKNLTITHKKDSKVLLKDFTWALNPGDKAAVIGEEGNGKSTFLKLLCDPALVEDYADYSGEIIRGRNHMGYLSQEPGRDFAGRTILEFFEESPVFYQQDYKELARVGRQLDLPADIFYSAQKVGTLSGGERVKLGLARILMEEPDVLLLDEPSNDLDLNTLKWLENFIQNCDLPLIYISHDETLLENTANVILHFEMLRRKTMPRHTIARQGYADYVKGRLAKMEHQEQVARKEEQDYKRQQERYRQIMEKVDHQQKNISRQDPHGGRLLKKKMHAVKSMGRRMERDHESQTRLPETEEAIMPAWTADNTLPAGKIVLEFDLDVLKVPGDAGEKILAENIHLKIRGPEKICIIGKNGAGKTTLLRQMAQKLLGRKDLVVVYMPQNYEEGMDFSKTPVEFLEHTGDKEAISRARAFLGSMKYTPDEMFHSIDSLSGGQRAKLFFLKMILDGANVLILDEPTRNFSPLSNPVIRRILREFRGCILSISHDRKYISQVCDTIYELTPRGLSQVFDAAKDGDREV